MSIYGDADGMDSGLSASGGGTASSGKGAFAAVTDAAGPVLNGLKAKAAADPQKAKIVAAVVAVLIVAGIGWGVYDTEYSAIARCDDSCPDILFSAGLINGRNGTQSDGCGQQHVHDPAGGHTISLHGDTRVSEIGAHFDGGGECVTFNLPRALARG